MPKWLPYWNKTITEQTLLITSMKAQGYRPVSLSMTGSPLDPNLPIYFSSIWVKRSGPPWTMMPLGDEGELNAFLEEHKTRDPANPYWPRLIAACGLAYPRFSVVVEQGPPEAYVEVGVFGFNIPTRFDLAWSKFGEYPISTAIYGTSIKKYADESFMCAFVWRKQGILKWIYFNGFTVSEAEVGVVDAAMQAGFTRADYVAIYDELTSLNAPTYARRYFMMYRNDRIPGTIVESNIPASNVQTTIDNKKPKWPLRIHADLPGPDQRYAIVFADYPYDEEPARALTISRPTYPASAGPNPWSPFAALETAFIISLIKCSFHAGQIAVVYQGRLVYTAAFTWAPPGYPIAKPFTRFRLGSMSKTVTALAVCRLWDQGRLYADSTDPKWSIATLLKRTFKDDRFKTRNCGHLLAHLGRINESTIVDNTDPFKISSVLKVPLPIKIEDAMNWVALKLDNCFTDDVAPTPATNPLPTSNYEGAGFTMLAEIAAIQYKKKPWLYKNLEKGVLGEVFNPLGVKRPRPMLTKVKDAAKLAETSEEALAHPSVPRYGFSQQFENPHEITPIAYDSNNSDVYLGNGAWAMSAVDYVRLLAAFDESPNPLFSSVMQQLVLQEQAVNMYRGFFKTTLPDAGGNQIDSMSHSGAVYGGESIGFRRFDGVSIVFCYNTDTFSISPKMLDWAANNLVNKVTSWPTYDLFPAVLK